MWARVLSGGTALSRDHFVNLWKFPEGFGDEGRKENNG